MTPPTSVPQQLRLLLVDDSASWTSGLARYLRDAGWAVDVEHEGLAAVERIRRSPPPVLLTDYFLPGLDGGKLCQIAKAVRATPPIRTVVLTAGSDRELPRIRAPWADAVIAKNTIDVVGPDICRVLDELGASALPSRGERTVIGHERLHPRSMSRKVHTLKQYVDALHAGVGDAVIGVDHAMRIYTFNGVAAEVFDLDEPAAIARRLDDVLDASEEAPLIEHVRDALAGARRAQDAVRLETRGRWLHVRVTTIADECLRQCAVVVLRDLTDLRDAERGKLAVQARLHQAEKLASMGMMVAGVSHEINNPLASLIPSLDLLRESFETILTSHVTSPAVHRSPLHEIPEILRDCRAAAERIRVVVTDMKRFAHSDEPRGAPASIRDLLASALSLASSQIRLRAELRVELGDTPLVIVDADALQHAFLNILLNAVQAIEQDDPERHWIRAACRTERHGVVVEISNSGPNIPKETLAHIFDPFFTTKPEGEGVGLGLSISHETVRRHGGTIDVESEPRIPTTFRVWIPRDTGLGLREDTDEHPSEPPPRMTRARLLIVDDEQIIRSTYRRALEHEHDVEVADDGLPALELIEAGHRYDLILCDLIMPGMSGMELHNVVRRRWPDVAARFLFLTGGTSSASARGFLARVDEARSYKPLTRDELCRLIRRCLARSRASEATAGGGASAGDRDAPLSE